ncbi:MAG: ribonuclease HII [Polyangiaceae bacterium]|nr:ribonuclease HII [Polyangiaceae bacterium]
MPPSLAELRRSYVQEERPMPTEIEAALREDPRSGAQAILRAVERRRAKNRSEGRRLRQITTYERELWETGVEHIAGVDEAGMGPLAGPVAAAAVVLPCDCRIVDVDDSKKLDAKTRERLAETIRETAVAWSVVLVEPEEIDRINIYQAGMAAMKRAVLELRPAPSHLLVDARRLEGLPMKCQAIVKGDQKSLSIAAASILAKTRRDAVMNELDREFPGYGFKNHKGYAVPEHYEALRRLGPCPAHRRSFQPVQEALGHGVQAQLGFMPGDRAAPGRRRSGQG